jgi:hypothetical protein
MKKAVIDTLREMQKDDMDLLGLRVIELSQIIYSLGNDLHIAFFSLLTRFGTPTSPSAGPISS